MGGGKELWKNKGDPKNAVFHKRGSYLITMTTTGCGFSSGREIAMACTELAR
jgi:hypothetical protein